MSQYIDVSILLSGGIDSMACIPFYLDEGASVSALFCNYGQLSFDQELAAATAIAKYYNIELNTIKCEGLPIINGGEIISRNSLLIILALYKLQKKSGVVAIGIHSGTSYIDCSDLFIKKMQSIYDLYNDGKVVISAPFIKWTKQEIWDYCLLKEAPLELTYSCELGAIQPCGSCNSCLDLEVLYGQK